MWRANISQWLWRDIRQQDHLFHNLTKCSLLLNMFKCNSWKTADYLIDPSSWLSVYFLLPLYECRDLFFSSFVHCQTVLRLGRELGVFEYIQYIFNNEQVDKVTENIKASMTWDTHQTWTSNQQYLCVEDPGEEILLKEAWQLSSS